MAVGDFKVLTAAQIRDNYLRTIKVGLQKRGIANPNVAPGSDYYIQAEALGNFGEQLGANLQIRADQVSYLNATGDNLDELLERHGIERRAAANASGAIIFDSSASSIVPLGTELLDGQGLRYKVTVGGTYADGDTIPVIAVDAGVKTNLEAETVLRWISTPPYSSALAEVAVGGLTGGADAEDDETARQRLLRRLQFPPAAANWSHVAEITEASTPIVQAAFVYPAAQGPGTQHIAVVGYPSEENKTREVDALVLANTIIPYVEGMLPERAYTLVTTVVDMETDIAINLSLPAAASGSTVGTGQGWVDATPYPVPPNDINTYCDVTNVTSSTAFRVRSVRGPIAGASHIAWLSPVDWTVYTAIVLTSSNVDVDEWNITIDKPFPNIAVGHWISPEALRIREYFAALLQAFAEMGPGEKTDNSTILARAFRHPTPNTAWPYGFGPLQLRAITDVGDEVLAASYRMIGADPSTPASITDPPEILVPRNLAFYPTP